MSELTHRAALEDWNGRLLGRAPHGGRDGYAHRRDVHRLGRFGTGDLVRGVEQILAAQAE